ncbi:MULTISPECIES: Cof-type HAD-IIB family hydrolase [Pasteurellaceae]|uniref:Cof-type HAD-IIB family hydrolase n=1 Tax=Pasteurella atlantica TaxID=2827233 RepID=A0AAW8CNR9_9PAST|nr:Cof-type HAD-IIB family hydrolase [Pasteurella atlantica]MBR0573079.1 Cof-type HAD-IIB family hydrolase [Pasteurella atlantica]MDP8039064.1 Cof-type HAD-IIB family hydrolase [Pasteurella atlantica]MDP8041154.1 Cof-type HAD-IIB family hydrolase [Pasteurella atlantica]MDP8043233.1 Cof-type HAD-IIB family hydrolase [Pasteurella atlantica]MDP8045319.1 Cof-type HAD-IIB family hydrolase [Pasteurella atlantica]
MNNLNYPIKIVFFDIDDTLYYKKETRIPESIFKEVIPKLKAKGIIPAIATGRCLGVFPKPLTPLINAQGFELLVTINGQYNCYKNQIISKYPLDTTRIEVVIGQLKALNIEYGFVSDNQMVVSKETPDVIESLKPIQEDYIVDPEHYKHNDIMQMLAFYPQERSQEVKNSGLFGDDLKEVRWHPKAVDILDKTNSKAKGIQDVLAYFNIDIKNAMAFGDGLNDLEMLSSVGFGVAMGNSEEELKKLADYVTKPIWEDGVLFALKEFNII